MIDNNKVSRYMDMVNMWLGDKAYMLYDEELEKSVLLIGHIFDYDINNKSEVILETLHNFINCFNFTWDEKAYNKHTYNCVLGILKKHDKDKYKKVVQGLNNLNNID
ncbi:MAG: hypothetical protein GY928_11170 [Colwellia sp.]|nr:hypothetical protein [Colwellia sp.]